MMQYPSHIVEEAGQRTDRALREIIDKLNENEPQITALDKQVAGLKIPSIADIQKALQLGGTNTINITGVLGVAGQAQPSATIGTHAVRLTTPAALGTWFIESDRLVAYVGEQSGSAVVWVYVAGMMVSTFSNRPSDLGLTDAGFWFGASDQGNIAWRWNGTAFVYQYGIYERAQSQLAALAALLGGNDAGYLVSVTDFIHTLQWNGAGWQFAPSDGGSGLIVPFAFTPTAGVWQLCNGTAGITYLKGDGSTGSITVPNLSGATYIKGGGYSGPTVNAATNPTWVAGSKTDNAATGVTVAIDAHGTAADTAVTGAGTRLTSPVTHTATVTDPQHQHTLSDAVAKLNKIGDATWVPENMGFDWYFRR